ncbi:hypothetical protein K458DRAFT_165688 [Lentithecium fluviatile CBS 122367]|uniref:Uncharacterized protein n=1 Tax=Lentithecium fluviatile CBS 122367 TaxID=1168545 RepID=A0A6G1IGL8_9PLEO|nr:hypothetical protein K458DRAFT_165688 [Lentithecium fluviatile CBS 122367]
MGYGGVLGVLRTGYIIGITMANARRNRNMTHLHCGRLLFVSMTDLFSIQNVREPCETSLLPLEANHILPPLRRQTTTERGEGERDLPTCHLNYGQIPRLDSYLTRNVPPYCQVRLCERRTSFADTAFVQPMAARCCTCMRNRRFGALSVRAEGYGSYVEMHTHSHHRRAAWVEFEALGHIGDERMIGVGTWR